MSLLKESILFFIIMCFVSYLIISGYKTFQNILNFFIADPTKLEIIYGGIFALCSTIVFILYKIFYKKDKKD